MSWILKDNISHVSVSLICSTTRSLAQTTVINVQSYFNENLKSNTITSFSCIFSHCFLLFSTSLPIYVLFFVFLILKYLDPRMCASFVLECCVSNTWKNCGLQDVTLPTLLATNTFSVGESLTVNREVKNAYINLFFLFLLSSSRYFVLNENFTAQVLPHTSHNYPNIPRPRIFEIVLWPLNIPSQTFAINLHHTALSGFYRIFLL